MLLPIIGDFPLSTMYCGSQNKSTYTVISLPTPTPPPLLLLLLLLLPLLLLLKVKVKIKQSRNRPGVVQRVPGGFGSQISITFGT